MAVFQKILVPIDFSPHSGAALDLAARMAADEGAALHLLHVCHPPIYLNTIDPPTPPRTYWVDVRRSSATWRREPRTNGSAPSPSAPVPT